jgi:hypothetical protein
LIEFPFNAKARVLLVGFAEPISGATLAEFNRRIDRLVAREGTVDTVVDCSRAPAASTDALVGQGLRPTRMPGRRRVFVAERAAIYGVLRLHGSYQKGLRVPAPAMVGRCRKRS